MSLNHNFTRAVIGPGANGLIVEGVSEQSGPEPIIAGLMLGADDVVKEPVLNPDTNPWEAHFTLAQPVAPGTQVLVSGVSLRDPGDPFVWANELVVEAKT